MGPEILGNNRPRNKQKPNTDDSQCLTSHYHFLSYGWRIAANVSL
jgi:hypothetical protein